ncbi:hypothetical protein AXG93_2884s1180 [Marchantia polymorpha subsp. ruderalis]|uniref:Beta-galactosidase n=1 Tax=Marchantia polymorpha subsp. ruderalis TaxID=1480154 RepID=A0A176WMT0_MARPO|nr:hypothetical protein AXG93_2884s1180 [Marchantia polymorpha subsp. ruderalis]
MATCHRSVVVRFWASLYVFLVASMVGALNVSYDQRAFVLNGQRRLLISAGIHYPRATPEMWPELIATAKRGGANVIQTYVFWSGHEPRKGEYNFEGRYDLPKFVELVGEAGMYLNLRIGPYVCAEWNFGGFPVWLRDIPGIEFRTDNKQFKDEMETFTKFIVEKMRARALFAQQGGPIIMAQIENEYGNIEWEYGQPGKQYVKWAANMAEGLDAGVPWIMCQQGDAPLNVINTCNGYYCDGFTPNAPGRPTMWTEDWNGWYQLWGGLVPHRPVQDNAFAVARFYQRGGTFQNYYMAHVYTTAAHPEICAAFLANIDSSSSAVVEFRGTKYELPAWSVSILPDCKTVAYNTAKIHAQTSLMTMKRNNLKTRNPKPADVDTLIESQVATIELDWEKQEEPIGIRGGNTITAHNLLEQINTTKDSSDYLWYTTRFQVSKEDIKELQGRKEDVRLVLEDVRDALHVFVNGELSGSFSGSWFSLNHSIKLKEGVNEIALLCMTMGIQNYGAFLEKDGAGIKGKVQVTGLGSGVLDLTTSEWVYQVGLKGEDLQFFFDSGPQKGSWVPATGGPSDKPLVWYKTKFSTPDGEEPVALDLASMGKDSHPPLVDKWATSSSSFDAQSQRALVPHVRLECAVHQQISHIVFASFGSSSGTCGSYSEGDCHASSSRAVVEKACLGKTFCSLDVSPAEFGEDPCPLLAKTLTVQALCRGPSELTNENLSDDDIAVPLGMYDRKWQRYEVINQRTQQTQSFLSDI